MREQHEVLDVTGVFESLDHGETLTKFVAVDKGAEDKDFTVTVHGFVLENGSLIITDSIVTVAKEKK